MNKIIWLILVSILILNGCTQSKFTEDIIVINEPQISCDEGCNYWGIETCPYIPEISFSIFNPNNQFGELKCYYELIFEEGGTYSPDPIFISKTETYRKKMPTGMEGFYFEPSDKTYEISVCCWKDIEDETKSPTELCKRQKFELPVCE